MDDLVRFSAVLAGESGRRHPDEILVVESVGTAVLDVAAGEHVLGLAEAADVGTELALEP